jgi:hypothetical protein
MSRNFINHKKYFRFESTGNPKERAVAAIHFDRQTDDSVVQSQTETIPYSNIMAFLDFHDAKPAHDCKLELRLAR